jgi:hypothetical protein
VLGAPPGVTQSNGWGPLSLRSSRTQFVTAEAATASCLWLAVCHRRRKMGVFHRAAVDNLPPRPRLVGARFHIAADAPAPRQQEHPGMATRAARTKPN